MTDLLNWLSWVPLAAGAFFFIAGTLGLLRFPDVYSRLHAVTKADTLGLGLVALGLCLRAQSWQTVVMTLVVWLLVMASSTTACQLLARYQREQATKEHNDARD